MIPLDNAVWVSVKQWLKGYCRRDKSIRHCFIRHSTASGAQSVLLADFDLAFFVDATNFDDLQAPARHLRDQFKRSRIISCIVLPATEAAYRLCASRYPFRSIYPMKNWLRLYGEAPAIPNIPIEPLPLDHAPEAFLFSYIGPVMQKRRKSHVFERALLRRKLNRDSLQITGHLPDGPAKELHDVVTAEIRLWDEFYGAIEFTEQAGSIPIRPAKHFSTRLFQERWSNVGYNRSRLSGLASIWVHPCFFDKRIPYVVVNLEKRVTADECKKITTDVMAAFDGLDFRLQIGTEQSMRGRLGGLSRVSLIDPWLFKAGGHCLFGAEDVRDGVREPPIEQVRNKLEEYLLYLSYRVFCLRPYPYSLYSLAFTLDRLFRQRELVLDEDELGDIYGKVFLPQSRLQGPEGRRRVLDTWRDLHGFDLFRKGTETSRFAER